MFDDRTLSQQSELTTPTELGEVREQWGPFLLRERVGHGAFGEVYRAWDPKLEREVALKLLVPRAVTSDADYQQMLREARALASVRHANVVPVYGLDRHDDRVGFWTDFVHGSTLSSLVRTNGPFGYREAALIGIDVAHALSVVHRAGLLHRDIKAENVMRESGGRTLLMDFGLSSLPHHQSLAGTPAYMAPELFCGQAASTASDIYALGVLLFFLVAGEYPSPVKTVFAETADEIVRTRRSLHDLRPDLPDRFIRAIECCLCADAGERYQSVGMLASALSDAIGVAAVTPAHSPFGRRVAIVAAAVLVLAGAGATYVYRHTTHLRGMSADSSQDYFKAQDLLSRNYNPKGLTEAINLLNRIIRRDPSFALAEAGLGRAYYLESRNSTPEQSTALAQKAREACARALAIDRSLAPPYVTLARLDTVAGRTALAMQDVHQALEADPSSAEAYGAESELFEVEGRELEALAAAQKASDLAPEDWHWPMLLGVNHLKAGALQQAETDFLRAAELTPDNPLAYTNLAQAQMQLNQLPEAEASLRRILAIAPTVDVYSELGGLLTIEGKYPEAIAMNLKAVKLDPNSYENWGNLEATYAWSGDRSGKEMEACRRAAQLAEKARAATPRDPYVLSDLAFFDATLKRPDRALALLRQSLALAPANPQIVYKAGTTYELLGQRTQAIDLIARSQALGFGAEELNRDPQLATLRADPAFQTTVTMAMANKIDNAAQTK